MATHGILVPEAIAATNVDSFNRSAQYSGSSVDNGNVFQLASKVGTSGSGTEVFVVSAPATGSLAGLWMAYESWENVLTDSKYRGLDPDPKNFFIKQNEVFSAFKPQVGDVILATAEALTGTKSTNEYVVATNGALQLNWSATSIEGLTFKLLGSKYISLPNSSASTIDNQRVTAYELMCIINDFEA